MPLAFKEKASVCPTELSICWQRAFRQHEEREEGLKREPKRMWECDEHEFLH